MSPKPSSLVYYPESDGRPMGETDLHREAMVRHIELLSDYYRGQQVYVTGDLLVYYEEGNPKKFIVPDAFVAKGVAPGPRRTFLIWLEGKAPDVVIETTSRKTKHKDTVLKPALYARLGIAEYFLFDPEGDYLAPRLQGHRLEAGQYVPIEPDGDGRLASRELDLHLKVEAGQLQLYRRDNGERLLTAAERSERDRQACRAAKAEVARLREELRRLQS
jgi:Uma2 family endonuclease